MASEEFNGALSPEVAHASSEPSVQEAASPEYRQDQIERALYEIQREQNLPLGVAAGVVAGVIGAIAWAVVTVVTMFQIGWLAVGIGFLVGAAIRGAGRGTTQTFGIVGAVISLVSVLAGNFLSMLGLVAGEVGLSYAQTIVQFDYSQSLQLMAATFSPIDLLFYGIAVWEGYRFSIRTITPEEIHQRLVEQGSAPA